MRASAGESKARVSRVRILRNPLITPRQLYAFYVRTGVCEAGYPPRQAARVLAHSDTMFAAYRGNSLVGLTRGLFDGTAGHVVELCVDPELQGSGLRFRNASVIEKDDLGLGQELVRRLLKDLRKRGARFFTNYIVTGIEEPFYRRLGFRENKGHKVYAIDIREYVPQVQRIGRFPR